MWLRDPAIIPVTFSQHFSLHALGEVNVSL